MADIFTGKGLTLQYNEDTGNRSPQGIGNITINQVNTFPVLTISSETNNFETYDSDYKTVLLSDKTVEPLDIVVNYLPDDPTHQFLDNAADTQQLFQLIIQYQLDLDESTITYAIVNGYITSYQLGGDTNTVVTKSYNFTPSGDVVARAMSIAALLPIYQGDYGVGGNGNTVPQYAPTVPAGNSFIKVPSTQAGNPAGADMMGVGLVDGTAVSSIAMTKTGTLSIYAKNATTAWTRIYTATQMDSRYVPLTRTINGHALTANVVLDSIDTGSLAITNNLGDVADATEARSNLNVYSKEEVDAGVQELASSVDTVQSNVDELSTDSATNLAAAVSTLTTSIDAVSTDVSTNYVPKTTTVNGKALTGNVALSKAEVGLANVTNDAQLKAASNLSDLVNVTTARTNLGLGNAALRDVGTAAGNILLAGVRGAPTGDSGFFQTTLTSPETADWDTITSPGLYKTILQGGVGNNAPPASQGDYFYCYVIKRLDGALQQMAFPYATGTNSGRFFYRGFNAAWRPWAEILTTDSMIDLKNGGTGGLLKLASGGTQIFSPNKTRAFALFDTNDWGVWESGTSNRIALPVVSGGTGGTDYDSALKNLNAFKFQREGLGNVDLNSLSGLSAGAYMQPSSAYASTANNYPVASAGALVVVSNAANNLEGCTQFYYPYNATQMYMRRRVYTSGTASTWTEWSTVPTTDAANVWIENQTFNSQMRLFVNGEAIRLIAPANQASYIMAFTDNSGSIAKRRWYVGNGGADSNTVLINSVTNAGLQLAGNGSVLLQGRSDGSGTGAIRNFVINNDGNITGPLGTVTQTASDISLKSEVMPAKEGALDRINAIGCVEFNWDTDERRDRGFIAQQLAEIDDLYTFKVDECEYLNYSQTALMSDTFGAIQELSQRNDTLQTTLQNQQLQIDELKALVQSLIDNK